MAKISTSLGTARLLHPRETLFLDGSLAALNGEVVVDADGASSLALSITGTFVATIEVAGTIDGTNYVLIPIRPTQGGIYLIAATAAGTYAAACAGFVKIRARVTAYTSGAAQTRLTTSIAQLDESKLGNVLQVGTATGVSAAAVTLSLGAPGVGLRHYIKYIRIERHATALLTAGATPTVVTTTNLPGSLAFSIPVDAAAAGAVYEKEISLPDGFTSSAQNTATTIVCPTTTATIWRVTVFFYVAP